MPKDDLKIIKSWRRNSQAIEKYQFFHHFVSQTDNRATLLTTKSIIVYCMLLLMVTLFFRLLPKAFPGVLGYASNINLKELLDDTNKKRQELNLPPLRLNRHLMGAAVKKAEHMFKKNYWAHIAPDGTEPWSFVLSEDYDYSYAGENLAKNFSNSKDVVEAWYKSPSHRENLLSPNYDEVGFAIENGILNDYHTTLVVQMFGRPRDKSQLASLEEEQQILAEYDKKFGSTKLADAKNVVSESNVAPASASKPAFVIDISQATKGVNLLFGGFVFSLLGIDVWYSKRKGLVKFTGHTVAHLLFLVFILFSIWFLVNPGIISAHAWQSF